MNSLLLLWKNSSGESVLDCIIIFGSDLIPYCLTLSFKYAVHHGTHAFNNRLCGECINMLQYLSQPSVQYLGILDCGKLKECTQWTQKKCHIKSPMTLQHSYVMLFLTWHFSFHCRPKNWVRHGKCPKMNICCSLIKSTKYVSPTQGSEPVRVRKPSGKQIRLSLRSPSIAMGTLFYCVNQT